jgi:multidrug efflux pump subunit AcrA (membrane-fusion protein)
MRGARPYRIAWAAALAPALAGCGNGAGGSAPAVDPRDELVPVTVDRIRAEPLQRRVAVVGTLYPDEEVVLSNEVEGRVVEIDADVGDLVAPGAKLLRLDDTDYRLKLEQARFDLLEVLAKLNLTDTDRLAQLDVRQLPAVRGASAEKAFAKAELDTAGAAVRSAEADVKGAVAELANAEVKLRDAEANRRSGAATEQEVLDRRTRRDAIASAADAARARLEAARARVQSSQAKLEAAGAQEAIAIADSVALTAQARRKKAAVDQADKDAADTVVSAPRPKAAAGATGAGGARRYTVTARRVAVGDFARVPTELFRLMFTDPLKLRVHVPERYVGEVVGRQAVELRVEAYSEIFQGAVSRINVVNEVNRTFEVEIIVPNGHGRLNPGGFAKADILTRTDAGVPMVPQEALISFAGVTKFFLLDESAGGPVAREVQVRPGEAREFPGPRPGSTERWVEVRPVDPKVVLKPGMKLIASGATRLAEGTRVKVK